MKKTADLIALITLLRDKPLMILGDDSFNSIRSFINGFSAAQIFMDTQDIFGYAFRNWFYDKIDTSTRSLDCTAYILHVLSNDDEKIAKDKLFEFLLEYIEEIDAK